MRTYEEKAAIVEHCIELEKTGGDILGYLWSQNYYTPRATWCNFQREWLHRKPYEYTDGKPKKKGEIKMNGMDKIMADRQKRLEDLKNRINDGMGIRAALADMGYTGRSAGQVYRQIKNYAQENDPEAFAMLPEKISDEDTPVRTDTPTVKVDGPLRIETPEGNTIKVAELPEIIDGVTKEITVHEADMFEVPEGMVPLHMLKHPVKVNIVKDEPKITKPVNYDGMIVREVEGEFARYRRTDVNGNTFIDVEFPDGCDTISFTVGQWGDFRKEHNKAALILGVEL